MFFFFQAEDGIRDWSVTGVQTCALPISRRGDPRTRPELPVALPRVLPHRGRSRRPGSRDRGFLRRAPDRRAGFRLQGVFSAGGNDLHLRADARAALVASAGIVREEGRVTAVRRLAERHHLRWWETLPWIAGVAAFFVFPNYLAFGTHVLITILFALSLDLVLGYAGIVTLGHAAFFGAGAYTVGILALHFGWNEPLSGLVAAALVAGLVGLVSGFVLLRTQGLTLLMLTLCTMTLLEQAANMGAAWTGGFDGMPGLSFRKILGLFPFDVLYFRTQYLYALAVLLGGFVLGCPPWVSPFGPSFTRV